MKILIACEYSGRTRNAFAALGHDVISAELVKHNAEVSGSKAVRVG